MSVGAYICDWCGCCFPWTQHGETGFALMNVAAHGGVCPERPKGSAE